MIQARISGDKIYSNATEAFSLYEKSSFGEKKQDVIEYSPVEALFLLSQKKLSLLSGKKTLSEEELVKKIKKTDKKIETKFAAYTDLRKRGYILKTALKFGAEFRVYEKGVRPGEAHARWLLFTAKEHEPLSWQEFAAKIRIAHSTKKALLIGVVDDEGSVSYYEAFWLRP